MRASLAVAVLVAAAGMLRAPADAQAGPTLGAEVREAMLARLATAEGRKGGAGCLIVDLDSGRELFAHNDSTLLAPASNMKLLTSAAALCKLGPDFKIRTRVYSRGEIKDNTLAGDLCLVGGGEPNISGRFHDDDVLHLYRQWASRITALGVTSISGDLLFDSTLFGGPAVCEGWPDDQYANWYCAEVSALAFNDNCINIKVTPGKVGEAAKIELTPPTAYIKVVNETKTIAGKGAINVGFKRPRDENTYTVTGTVPVQSTWGYADDMTVHDPALYAATVFKETLKAAGVSINGEVKPFTMTADELTKFDLRVEHTSSLADALKPVNTNSQNLHAELLLRQIGLAYAGKGTFKTGEAALREFLDENELSQDGLVLMDGCGLAAADRLSARLLVGVLKLMAGRDDAAIYKASLAVGGESGTLEKRMKDKLLKGNVFAKTGYIAGVHALSGYLECGNRRLAFSFLMTNCADAKDAMDDILLMLAKACS